MSIFNASILLFIILLSAIALGIIITILLPDKNRKRMSDNDVKEFNATLAGVIIITLMLIGLLYVFMMTGSHNI